MRWGEKCPMTPQLVEGRCEEGVKGVGEVLLLLFLVALGVYPEGLEVLEKTLQGLGVNVGLPEFDRLIEIDGG